MKRKAFTLVEIMIVVLVIGILALIAVPQFLSARDNSRQKTCLSNLRLINDAKETFAMERRAPEGSALEQTDLSPAYINEFPTCPSGGEYTIGAVGTDPTCSVQTGKWPHALPVEVQATPGGRQAGTDRSFRIIEN